VARGQSRDARGLLNAASQDPAWEHQRRILRDDFGLADVPGGLRKLPAMLEKVARDVERSKAKDDERGMRIIDDYADAHTSAPKDKFVKQTWTETRDAIKGVAALIAAIESA